jgi:hypothetical protein
MPGSSIHSDKVTSHLKVRGFFNTFAESIPKFPLEDECASCDHDGQILGTFVGRGFGNERALRERGVA